ncbi:MAG: thioredoxin domain-containing protein [Bacteroidales bacterium]|jgi:thioredoxin|nr:thioredoxin domain-containing protein [Bacteroidales bacterium]NCU34982.1 thiol reductase thioredoxin [Candidatus Falkowbacteria bacterium]MDD2632421.1 thioredoxin domain-containing protein [Bacteroidales bacterium]MDD3132848.1 thioredoxin domain-containing protein [Bacteroidales bacterium]MDD4177395.1 thioredoxin domain-containing protein [Bacteroidales bacterium]
MRKTTMITIISLLIAFSSTACNNTSGDEKQTAMAESTANVSGDTKTSSSPEFLTVETFKSKIWNYEKNPQEWIYEGSEPAIIDFYADWCKPCKMVAPVLEEIAQDYQGKLKVYKIDTQVEKELAAVFQISSIPAFLYIPAQGQPRMDRGYKDKAAFERIIQQELLKN